MNKAAIALTGALCALLLPTAASAYIGPGAGASLAASLWGVLAAIGLAVAVVLFWPLRLVFRRIKRNRAASSTGQEASAAGDASHGAAE